MNLMRSVGIAIRGDNTSFKNALKDSSAAARELGQTVGDQMGKVGPSSERASQRVRTSLKQQDAALRESERNYRQMGQTATGVFGGISSSLGRLVGGATLVTLATQVGRVGFNFLEFQQNAQVSFETMLGSADAARTFLADVLDFAKQTPFAFTDLTASAQRMLAFGMETEKIIPTLRALGDAATGTGGGTEKLNGLSMAIGQIASKGRLQSEEILQLAERGIPALTLMANQAGKTAEAFQKDVTAGLIDADTAIDWLVDGLQNGTEGVNGTTAAFGGLMEQIKGNGGITATVDSAKSSFRNMSGELLESLLPAIISLISVGTDVMAVVGGLADKFNALPKPLRDAALALAALAIAQRVFRADASELASGGLQRLSRGFTTASTTIGAMDGRLKTIRFGLAGMRSAAVGGGAALMGAFGGPVGLAVAGVTLALSNYVTSSAAAKEAAKELSDVIDGQTGAWKENADEVLRQGLLEDRSRGVGRDKSSMVRMADDMKIETALLEEAWGGKKEAVERAIAEADAFGDAAVPGIGEGLANRATADAFILTLANQQKAIDTGKTLAKDEAAISGAMDETAKSAENLAAGYGVLAAKMLALSADEEKIVGEAGLAARKAFDSAFTATGMDLALSTAEDVTKATEAVADANRAVRDAEAALQETRGRKDASANDIIRGEEAVVDARKKSQQAAEDLADTEKRRNPVRQYRKQQREMLKEAERFAEEIKTLGEKGLNGQSLLELIAKGPEGSRGAIDAMLKDNSLIGETNTTQRTLADVAGEMELYGELAQGALLRGGANAGSDFTKAVAIAGQEGAAQSVYDIAVALGEHPDEIRRVGRAMGLVFMEGFADIEAPLPPFLDPLWEARRDPRKGVEYGLGLLGFHDGGIYPGYTPGRDTGIIAVGGGEAIMRPEWTRAVGPDFVHKMNAIARSGGASAVRQAMNARFLGAFANGGIPMGNYSPAPHVVTVPVTQTVGYPMTVENVNVTTSDPAEFERRMRNQRRRAFTGGRP